jgi:hypothetical protein
MAGRPETTRHFLCLNGQISNLYRNLQIRMVAGFTEVIEGKRNFGCGGLQPSEFVSPAGPNETDSGSLTPPGVLEIRVFSVLLQCTRNYVDFQVHGTWRVAEARFASAFGVGISEKRLRESGPTQRRPARLPCG